METSEVIARLEEIHSAGKIVVVFRVIPQRPLKEKSYKDLNKVSGDFNRSELEGASFIISVNSVSVGKLDTEEMLSILYT